MGVITTARGQAKVWGWDRPGFDVSPVPKVIGWRVKMGTMVSVPLSNIMSCGYATIT